MNLQLQAQLLPEDYIEAQRLHVGWRIFIRLSLLMFIIMTAVPMAVTELGRDRFWIGPVIWLIWILIFRATYPQSVARRARKHFYQRADFQLPLTATITDEQVTMAAPGRGESISPWADAYKWKANEKIVLVYQSDNLFRMFPRRWFASDADFAGFKEFLTKTIGPMGKARKVSA